MSQLDTYRKTVTRKREELAMLSADLSTQKSIHRSFIKKQIPYIHGKSRKRGVEKRGNTGQALEMVQNRLLAWYGGERSRTNLSRLLRSDHIFM